MNNATTLFLLIIIYQSAFSQALFNNVNVPVSLTAGVSLTINGDLSSTSEIDNQGHISLTGDLLILDEHGLFRAGNGELTLNGPDTQFIRGFDLEVDIMHVNSPVALQTNLFVGDEINLEKGTIDMGGNLIELALNATLEGETDKLLIKGEGILRSMAMLTGPVKANPGNIGVNILSLRSLGATTIEREHKSVALGKESSSAVMYTISPTSSADLQASLWLNYYDAAKGLDESILGLFSYSGLAWDDMGGIPNPRTNEVLLTRIEKMSTWTIGEAGGKLLPLSLLSFDATVHTNRVRLDWETELEHELKHYEIQRSSGNGFQTIAKINARNEGSAAYQVTDLPEKSGTYYYRLKMVEVDKSYTYSEVVSAAISIQTDLAITPNPAIPGQQMQLSGFNSGAHSIQLYDLSGREVLNQKISEQQNWVLPADLESGVFIYSVQGDNETILQGKLVTK